MFAGHVVGCPRGCGTRWVSVRASSMRSYRLGMPLDIDQRSAIALASEVKRQLVDFALTPPFERHLRRLARELAAQRPDVPDLGTAAVEHLLFEFRYDDGSTVVDRFVARSGVTETEEAMARGFLDGYEGFFELLTDVRPGTESFTVRCCLSDLEYLVVPTMREGVRDLSAGAFLVGRLIPVGGTELWTLSGVHELLPASARETVAAAAGELALQAPWLTHRNPEYQTKALAQVAATHDRFLARHGSDLVLVEASALAAAYAEVIVGDDIDAEAAESSRAMARRTVDESELSHGGPVLVHSHPVAGLGFYQSYPAVARALAAGAAAEPSDLSVVSAYLEDPDIPAWTLRRIVAEHLPAAEAALATATRWPDFIWVRDGEQLLASAPGDQEPMPTLAILPSICTESAPQ
jgi:hypothetical protein